VIAWLLILTLPLYGLPVHALAPVPPGSKLSDPSPRATGGLPPVLEDVGRVSHANEALQPITEPSPSSLLYVNNTDPTCQGQTPCYSSIQAAIDDAHPGDTIRIQPGEYNEAIRIASKQDLVIEADPEAPAGSVMLGSASQKCRKGDAIQIESSQSITLRGLTITDAGGQSIQLFGGKKKHNEDIRIERNRMYSNGTSKCLGGLLIGSENTDILIVNNLIYGNGQDGVKITGAKGGPHYLVQNTIHGNRRDGVTVSKGQTVVLLNNVITHNGTDPKPKKQLYGVRRTAPKKKSRSENAQLLHNLICGNTQGELSGPMLDDFDAGNVTPTGTEGPGVMADPTCADVTVVYADVNGPDGEPNTADDDFTLAQNSPAIDMGADPRVEIPEVEAVLFEADFAQEASRPRDGDADGNPVFDSGALEAPGRQCRTEQTEPCYDGSSDTKDVGLCHAGTHTCQADGTWGQCDGQVLPALEVCDGLDNDCDAQTDEELGQTICGVGACQVTVDNCVTGTPQTCMPGSPTDEVCNSIDDDCDRQTDEGNVCNHAPDIISEPVITATVGQPYGYDVEATDPDTGDVLTFSLVEKPGGMTIDSLTGLIQWTPTTDQVGDNTVKVKVEDQGGLFDEQSFTATVEPSPLTCVPPPSSMVSWWPGDGNAADLIGANDGALQGNATFAQGVVEQAFSFDGVGLGNFVQVPDSPLWTLGADDFTVDLWVKFNQVKGRDPFIGHDDGNGSLNKWIFWFDNSGHGISGPALRFHINGPSLGPIDPIIAPWTPTTDHWYHVAVTRQGSTYALYIDGGRVATATDSHVIQDAAASLTIGRAEAYSLNGLVDEVEIFNRTLSAQEIQAIYNAGSAGKCKDGLPPDKHPPTITSTPTTSRWEQVHPTGTPPTPRYWSSMQAYDEINDRQIFFSGEDNSPTHPHTADVWVLVNATGTKGAPEWINLVPEGSGPVGRMGFASAYDVTANRLIVYGGCLTHCGEPLSDTWVLTNANGLGGPPTWTVLPSGNTKAFGAAGYDPISNRMIVFGGLSSGPGSDTSEVRILVDANGIGTPTWMTLQTNGTAPPPRGHEQPAVYDPLSNRLIVFGGETSGSKPTLFNDTWVLSYANGLGGSSTWTQLHPTGTPPSLRGGHSMVYDPNSNRLVIFGGVTTTPSYLNEVWTLTHANGVGGTPEWRQLTTPGDIPTERSFHSVGYARASNRMVMALGRNDFTPAPGAFNDAWVLANANGQCTAGQPCNYDVEAADPDTGDTLTFSLDTAPNGMTIDPATGLIEWTPTLVQIGDHNVQVRVTDPSGLFATQSFTLTVAPVAVPNVVGLDPASAEALIGAADLTVGTETHTGGEVKLNFDTLPSKQGWVYDSDGAGSEAGIFSLRNGVLAQDSFGVGGRAPLYYYLNAVGPRFPMTINLRARVLAEELAIANNDFGFHVHAFTPRGHTGVGIAPQEIRAEMNGTDGILNYFKIIPTPYNDQAFHNFRVLVSPQIGYQLLIDNQVAVSGKVVNDTLIAVNPPGIGRRLSLGDGTQGPNSRAEVAAYSFSQPHVTSQNPPAGTLVPNKSDVDLTIQDGPATATVPNVVGLTRTAAETAIVAANLTVGMVTEEFSVTVPAGSVISQKPVAGTHVVPQTAVDLVVSRGPPPGSPTAMNDSYGTNESTSLSVPAPGVLGNDTDPEGNTLSAMLVSSPAHGSLTLNDNGSFTYTPNTDFLGDDTFTYKANDGALDSNVATVTINVAGGNQTVLVPNVVGQTQADAVSMLVAANLKAGVVTTTFSDTVPAGNVISQNPAAGTAVAPQTAVDLVVSLGPNPQKVTVPNVVGQTQTAATTTLTGAQLGVGNVTTVDTTIPLSFTSLPSTQNWLYGATGNTAPESQVFSVANGVLRQNTIGVTPNGFNRYQRAAGVLAALPFALTVTARVLQDEGDPTDAFGFGFGLAMGTEQFAFGLRTNGIHGPVGNTLSAAIDTTQFHEYRMEGAPGLGFRLFVDGLLIGSSAAGARSPAPVPFLFFGDLSDTANARGEITSYSFVQGAGLVIDQNPDAGVLVSQGSLVDLTLAKAANPVTVPNVVGLTQATAITSLFIAKLLVGHITEEFSTTVPQGSVISQNPVADSVVPEQTAVDLKISRGPPQGIVPNVVGLTQAAAEAAILAAGFTVGAISSAPHPTVPQGNVSSQTPTAGSAAQPGSAVSFVVSLGPPQLACTLSSILVQPEDPLILVNQTQAFTAIGICNDGTSQNLNGLVAWASSATAIATIDTNGVATGLADGTTEISASVSGITGSTSLTVKATTPGDTTPPTAEITAPADDATITSPTDVIGTATDANFFKYVLEYAPVGQVAFTTLTTGSAPVTNGVLGSFDPTLLINDLYTLRLTVYDRANNTTTTEVRVQVDREQKVGNFTLAFQDVSIPMACLPITVTRTYDSRDKIQGDFGVGWRLDVKTIRLRESSINEDGKDWRIDRVDMQKGLITVPTYFLIADDLHKVSLTLPDGKVEEFDLTPQPSQSELVPPTDVTAVYAPRPGTLGSLTVPADQRNLIVSGSLGAVELLYDDFSGLYDPPTFLYTTPDGTEFTIHRTNGVQSVQCTNGQMLTFSQSGITHSAGKGVTFTRDAQGRITHITDPNGNMHTYTYDANGDLSSYSDPEGNTTTFLYDFRHGLLEIKDPRGVRAIRNEYDDNGRLISHTDASGQKIEYTHDLVARTETVKDRLGHISTYKYDAQGNVLEQIDALGNKTTFTYDAFGNEETRTDPLGRTTIREYDLRRNVLREEDPLGNETRYTYSALNAVKTITDPLGRVTTNDYDSRGNLLSTTDPLGKTTSYTYDTGGVIISGRGNLLSTTDALGHTTHYAYDGLGNQLTKETDPAGHETTYEYDANGNRTTQTTTKSGETLVTTFTYDKLNRLTKTTYPDNSTTQTVYNAIGKQAKTIDQLGRETSYEYDSQGRLTTTIYPDGTSESSTYDAEGRRLTSTDRGGRVTSYEYDALGRLVKTTHPGGAFETTTYDAAGQVKETGDALGHVTKYTYDKAGRREKVTDALNHVTTFKYDDVGNQEQVIDANLHVTTYEYDKNNRRVKVIYPDSTFEETKYDALGRTEKKTDQAGKMTQFAYDELGRLEQVTDALGQETTYTYDEMGNQLTQTDANNHTTSFAYDDLGRRVKRTLPLGQFETYDYDDVGNLASKTDFNGKTTTYDYDNVNRLETKTPDPSLGEPTVTFTYTDTGQRETMTDASGVTSYSYDQRDRLTSKATPQGTLTYTYDLAGNLLSMNSSNANGVSVSYEYDALNRLEKVIDHRQSDAETTYEYDNVGNLDSYLYPNGVRHQYVYNNLNRLTDLTVGKVASPTLASYLYDLGPAGNRLAVTDKSGRTASYTYDDLYRLTKEEITEAGSSTSDSISYVYDPVGNRLSRTSTVPGIVAQTFTYDNNDRLNTDVYDDNGNTVGSDGNTYDYDFENHLTDQNGGNVSIVYDGDGNRVSKTVGGVVTEYLVDDRNLTGYAQVVEEIVNDTMERVYTYGLDLISQQQPSGVSYYGYDGHGSVRLLTDTNGNITDTYDYDAFGNLIHSTGSTPNNYLYSGEQNDPNVGFYYLRARYYIVKTGAFLNLDTYEGNKYDPHSLHKYLYAYADPTNNSDPSGQFTLTDALVRVAIVGVLASIGARIGYKFTGTRTGAIWGGIAGGVIGASIVAPVPGIFIRTVLYGVANVGFEFFGFQIASLFPNPPPPASLRENLVKAFAAGAAGSLAGGLISRPGLTDNPVFINAVQAFVASGLRSRADGKTLRETLILAGTDVALAVLLTHGISTAVYGSSDVAQLVQEMATLVVSLAPSLLTTSVLEYLRQYRPEDYRFITG
jgi:RHS repeat-associated protein